MGGSHGRSSSFNPATSCTNQRNITTITCYSIATLLTRGFLPVNRLSSEVLYSVHPELTTELPYLLEERTHNTDSHSVCFWSQESPPGYKDSSGRLPLTSLPFEPYHQLSSSSICQLLNPDMADKSVSGPLLQEVRQLCRQLKGSLKVCELREHLDRLSLFTGRNPLVSSVAIL